MGKCIGIKERYYYWACLCFVLSQTTLFIGIYPLIVYAVLSACFFVFLGAVVGCVYSLFCRYPIWAKLPKNKRV